MLASSQWLETVCRLPQVKEVFGMKKIYVGNLNFNSTDEGLNTLFAEFGQVNSATVVMDRITGRSRGFGFVEMENDDEATAAIQALDGKEWDDRVLKVNEARPRAPRGGGGGGRPRW